MLEALTTPEQLAHGNLEVTPAHAERLRELSDACGGWLYWVEEGEPGLFDDTKAQFLDGSKDVTRRIGWRWLTAGTELRAVEKAMGLRKGEKQVALGTIRVRRVTAEPLDAITKDECRREGFPEMSPAEFVAMFCKANQCAPDVMVRRIEFERVLTVEPCGGPADVIDLDEL